MSCSPRFINNLLIVFTLAGAVAAQSSGAPQTNLTLNAALEGSRYEERLLRTH
jgi:hypothetical protein